jgi:uncharacterized protein YqjF (DUF2071 family)
MYPAPTSELRLAMREEPKREPVMFQTWSDLLFLHWEWDPVEIQKTLPPGLFVDLFDGHAYLGVIPFFISDLRASFLPPIPGTTDFLELNVRTYVHDKFGRPGVWFYSLDCNQALAVAMAKMFYSLPYQNALISARNHTGVIEYTCHRVSAGEEFKSEYHYKAKGDRLPSQPGSLPFFLVERYLLFSYAQKSQKLYSAQVHHTPYELFHAHLGRWDTRMLQLNKFDPKLRQPDHVTISPAPLRVKIYPLDEVPL